MTTIQESDINFRTLTYELHEGIYVCDPNGTFIYANLALVELFGFEHPADIVGRNFIEFFPPGKGQVFMNQFQKSMAPGTKPILITNEILKNDGRKMLVEIKPMPFIKNGLLLGNQGVVHDITKYSQAEKDVMYTSTHDSLTGIYNRSFFEAEIKRLERGRQFPISIIIVKVGGLKNLRESNGDEAGDKFLKRVAHRLFRSLRGDDIVARIGEDEFAILFPSVDENTIDEIIKRVQDNLLEINKDEFEPALVFYIGASTAEKGEQLDAVLKRAEAIAALGMKKNHNK